MLSAVMGFTLRLFCYEFLAYEKVGSFVAMIQPLTQHIWYQIMQDYKRCHQAAVNVTDTGYITDFSPLA